eukprot:3334982-Prorocentrum_lima.AAC.1
MKGRSNICWGPWQPYLLSPPLHPLLISSPVELRLSPLLCFPVRVCCPHFFHGFQWALQGFDCGQPM